MKNLLWICSTLLILQTIDLYGSTPPPKDKRNSRITIPSYKVIKEQYGIELKWHQRIKYNILKIIYGRKVKGGEKKKLQDGEKKIKQAKKIGLISLITGILGLILLWIVPEAGLILAVAAIVGGIVSIKRNPKKGTSIAAIIIGGSIIIFGLIFAMMFAIFLLAI